MSHKVLYLWSTLPYEQRRINQSQPPILNVEWQISWIINELWLMRWSQVKADWSASAHNTGQRNSLLCLSGKKTLLLSASDGLRTGQNLLNTAGVKHRHFCKRYCLPSSLRQSLKRWHSMTWLRKLPLLKTQWDKKEKIISSKLMGILHKVGTLS